MRSRAIPGLFLAALLASAAHADFEFTDFSSTAGLMLNGIAAVDRGTLYVTPNAGGVVGSVFAMAPQVLAAGFETSFTVNLSGPGSDFGQGDGMAFMIQSSGSRYLGNAGSGLGYEGAVVGLVVEIDTWPDVLDEVAVHVTQYDSKGGFCVLTPEDDAGLLASATGLTIKDGNDHVVRIAYQPGQLAVFLDGSTRPLFTAKVDLATYDCDGFGMLDGDGAAWIGFTASTGGAQESHALKQWGFTNGTACALIPGGPAADECMALNGSAAPLTPFTGQGLRLTRAQEGQAGSGWAIQKQQVACGFDTTFTVQLSGGADGMAFVVQDEGPRALGGGGSGLGYGTNGPIGITRSLAVELDTFGFSDEFPVDHVSIQTNGVAANSPLDAFSVGHAVIPFSVDDGQLHQVRVQYLPGSMKVWVDGGAPVLVASVDLRDIGGQSILDESGSAWVGFTAGTGGVTQSHDVLFWSFSPTPAAAADLNGDCRVNGADLGLLLGSWGAAGGIADLNGDGIVNGADLGALLGAWTG